MYISVKIKFQEPYVLCMFGTGWNVLQGQYQLEINEQKGVFFGSCIYEPSDIHPCSTADTLVLAVLSTFLWSSCLSHGIALQKTLILKIVQRKPHTSYLRLLEHVWRKRLENIMEESTFPNSTSYLLVHKS